MKRLNKGMYLIVLIFLSFGMCIVEVFSGLRAEIISDRTYWLWSITFMLLTAIWVNEDANRSDFEKPFELSFLIYVFWPVTLPWYLMSTRGVEGLVMVFGFAVLYTGPWVAGVMAFYFFA